MQPLLSQIPSQRQTQILAPQMRQSLEFLQAPMMELRSLIRRELEQNPVLEERPEEHEPLETTEEPAQETGAVADDEMKFKEEFEQLARQDDDWRELFLQTASYRRHNAEEAERRQHLFDSLTTGETLQEHLLRQLGLVGVSEPDRKLATLIIGCVNEDGWLNSTLGEMAETTGSDIRDLERLLKMIQDMDPAGVGARTLEECLLLQLERRGRGPDSVEARIIQDHLKDLGARRHSQMARALGVPVSAVHEAARVIATLDPKPGRPYAGGDPVYVVPELTVVRQDREYVCIPNRERMPRLRISRQYRQLMERPDTPRETREYIRDRVRAGAALLKSLQLRQETILNIAREIVKAQHDFFERGVAHLRPLVMADIAKILGLHETTISRAIAGKFMDTPRGVFEMKYFFTPGYTRADGLEVSNKAIKDAIERLVADENPRKPLSDQAMVERLQAQGIRLARRTIAKYREELHILPSHLRKG